MLICPECGVRNPLGRVFCTQCGAKLKLSDVSRKDIAGSRGFGWACRFLARLVAVVLVAALVVGGLALWPETGSIGARGSKHGARRVKNQIGAIRQLRAGESLGVVFAEKDINGYLRFLKAKKLKAESISVFVVPGVVRVHLLRVFGPVNLVFFELAPRLSIGLTCVTDGGDIRVQGASVGHLPLRGRFALPVARSLGRMLSTDKDWELAEVVADIKAEDGKLLVLARKK